MRCGHWLTVGKIRRDRLADYPEVSLSMHCGSFAWRKAGQNPPGYPPGQPAVELDDLVPLPLTAHASCGQLSSSRMQFPPVFGGHATIFGLPKHQKSSHPPAKSDAPGDQVDRFS